MKEALDGKLLLSILAGVTITQLQAMVSPATKVVRTMPNTPCKVSLSPLHTSDVAALTVAGARTPASPI